MLRGRSRRRNRAVLSADVALESCAWHFSRRARSRDSSRAPPMRPCRRWCQPQARVADAGWARVRAILAYQASAKRAAVLAASVSPDAVMSRPVARRSRCRRPCARSIARLLVPNGASAHLQPRRRRRSRSLAAGALAADQTIVRSAPRSRQDFVTLLRALRGSMMRGAARHPREGRSGAARSRSGGSRNPAQSTCRLRVRRCGAARRGARLRPVSARSVRLACVEALAHGLPVVAHRLPGRGISSARGKASLRRSTRGAGARLGARADRAIRRRARRGRANSPSSGARRLRRADRDVIMHARSACGCVPVKGQGGASLSASRAAKATIEKGRIGLAEVGKTAEPSTQRLACRSRRDRQSTTPSRGSRPCAAGSDLVRAVRISARAVSALAASL